MALNRRQQILWFARLLADDPRGMVRESVLRATEFLTDAGRADQRANLAATSTERYHQWITATEPDQSQLERQANAQRHLAWRPRISVITPVLAPPESVLVALLDAVLAQTYDNFELCVGHFSDDQGSRSILERYAAADGRVRLAVFPTNEGISRNSARCADLATGEYFALLDHDDTIAPNALYEYVVALNERPFDLAYSDRDKLSADGTRHEPFLKTHWAPDTLLSTNYLTHLTVFSRAAYEAAGGWDPGMDGAQDWDLFLRISERAERVVHIPKVLYHWRESAGSTARAMSAKPFSWAAQRRAVQGHVERRGIDAEVASRRDGSIRLDWTKPEASDMQVVLLASTATSARQDVRHLRRRLPRSVPVHVATEGSPASLDLRALAAQIGPQANVVVIGSGVRLRRMQSLGSLVGWLGVPGVGAVGGKVVTKWGGISDVGRVLHLVDKWGPVYRGRRTRRSGPYGSTYWYTNVYSPTLKLFAVRLDRIRQAGDEATEMSFLDLFELINRSGHRCVYTPDFVALDTTRVAGSSHPLLDGNRLPIPATDPYFNPNLSRDHLIPTIAT